MAAQKSYNVKIFAGDGVTFLKNLSPAILKNVPTFVSKIAGGLGECVLDLDLPFDDFDEGTSIDFMNIVDIYAVDAANPRGRRIYRGFISQYEPYIDQQGNEGVRVTLLGLVSLLSFSYYKSGSSFSITQSAVDPETIAKAIVDHFNTIYPAGLINYAGTTTAVGTNVSFVFSDQKWADALKTAAELAGAGFWWKVDEDGAFWFMPKPSTATHTFTIGKDIVSLTCPKDSEKVINDIQVRRSGGTTSDYSDATSQTAFGVRTEIITDSGITTSGTADQRAAKEIADNKDDKIKATIVVNQKYDLESIKVGETCRVRNFRKASDFFSSNMQIVSVQYNGDSVSVELEEHSADFARELSALVSGA